MSVLFWLTDEQMARLQPYFPKSHGRERVDDRRVLSGIIFVNRNGLRWRDAPREYGPAKTLYNRWKRWSDKGIFIPMMEGLATPQAPDRKGTRCSRFIFIRSAGMRHTARPLRALQSPPGQRSGSLPCGPK